MVKVFFTLDQITFGSGQNQSFWLYTRQNSRRWLWFIYDISFARIFGMFRV